MTDLNNPETIEIHGLRTIHKLCHFGADNNMEGCTFTEIVERMFVELEKSKAQAVPEVPVLTFGYGDIDVMEGIYQGSYSLMFGKNGGGVVGGNNQANRIADDDELHIVFKFHNEKSIRVVIDRLLTLHKRLCNKEPVEIKDANGEVIQTIYASESGAEG
ncbi:Uncharacterised protein [Acinetobacter pittii]|uniref:hypothetical protein n=1 Tax=Acinetobacter pittii TaxID=48296 RepID=UPI0003089513|nr:hypothetical protein [Acinetobacter pittii]SSP30574.1 Uncharacterised protein [Acinetobacter pittii]